MTTPIMNYFGVDVYEQKRKINIASTIMPKHYKAMMDELINKIDEDAPANAVGTGCR
jgi:hypothetical protein